MDSFFLLGFFAELLSLLDSNSKHRVLEQLLNGGERLDNELTVGNRGSDFSALSYLRPSPQLFIREDFTFASDFQHDFRHGASI